MNGHKLRAEANEVARNTDGEFDETFQSAEQSFNGNALMLELMSFGATYRSGDLHGALIHIYRLLGKPSSAD